MAVSGLCQAWSWSGLGHWSILVVLVGRLQGVHAQASRLDSAGNSRRLGNISAEWVGQIAWSVEPSKCWEATLLQTPGWIVLLPCNISNPAQWFRVDGDQLRPFNDYEKCVHDPELIRDGFQMFNLAWSGPCNVGEKSKFILPESGEGQIKDYIGQCITADPCDDPAGCKAKTAPCSALDDWHRQALEWIFTRGELGAGPVLQELRQSSDERQASLAEVHTPAACMRGQTLDAACCGTAATTSCEAGFEQVMSDVSCGSNFYYLCVPEASNPDQCLVSGDVNSACCGTANETACQGDYAKVMSPTGCGSNPGEHEFKCIPVQTSTSGTEKAEDEASSWGPAWVWALILLACPVCCCLLVNFREGLGVSRSGSKRSKRSLKAAENGGQHDDLFDQMDTDHDGKITKQEFLSFYSGGAASQASFAQVPYPQYSQHSFQPLVQSTQYFPQQQQPPLPVVQSAQYQPQYQAQYQPQYQSLVPTYT